MAKPISLYGVRRKVLDLIRNGKFYETFLGKGESSKDGSIIFERKGWKYEIASGGSSSYFTGWITFAVEELEPELSKLDSLGIKHEELIPPWLEPEAKVSRFFEPDGLMLQLEESTGITGGKDDIVLGVRDFRKAIRTYTKAFGFEVIRNESIFAELTLNDGPVLCLLKVDQVLKPLGTIILETGDLPSSLQAIEDAGLRIIGEPKIQEDGTNTALIRDDDENIFLLRSCKDSGM